MAETSKLALEAFEARYSPEGLFLRYARGRIDSFWKRQAFLLIGAVSLGILVDVMFGLLAVALVALVDLGDCLYLRHVLHRFPGGRLSPATMRKTEITAILSTGAGCAVLLATVHVVKDPATQILFVATIAGAALNAGLTYSYVPRITILRSAIIAASLGLLLLHNYVLQQTPLYAVAIEGAAALMAGQLVFVACRDIHRSFRRRVRIQHERLQKSVELEEANDALEAQTQLLERHAMVAHSANDCILIADADGKVEFVNETLLRTIGRRREELVGHPAAKGIPLEPEIVARISTAINAKQPIRTETTTSGPDGRELWLEMAITPLTDAAGDLTGHVNIVRDITETKQKEAELEAARQAAEESLRAKERFLTMMSHEIRTPLHGILATTELLQQPEPARDRDACIATLRESGRTLLDLVDTVLDVSSLESGRLTLREAPFDPDRLLDALEPARDAARSASLAFEVTKAPDLPATLTGDAGRIRQILAVLADNAVKFTDAGSVRVALGWQAGSLVLSVTDTGIGIAPEFHEAIFESFAQGEGGCARRFGGAGLGLSVARRLARQMGGDIAVESHPGAGATFTATLPLRSETGNAPTPVTAAPLDHARILVAEDNRTNRFLVERFLKDTGAELHFATDGFEAVAMAKSLAPDVILMDLSMPGMDGCAATRAILETADIRTVIIALTANTFESDRAACLAAGMADVLHKPITRSTLIERLGRARTTMTPDRANAATAEPPRIRTA
ncbi:hypothetical protein LX81_02906 [Palleronia aestuarii]|uniref:histidine kinase n=1 Tax=Palleronia aestuarii TaxID=568105 RepID=A0A2W7N3Q7_9RHOB|nr:PAS domain-containing hybrid sensor histidine kinase/response regulator [Palleronia aestuarii]PZX14323.1 hypothetical protein LX81_02906 [Palleronia aestuarii]